LTELELFQLFILLKMKQATDKSEQAIRQLSDKLPEIITEAHTTMIEMSAKFQVWSQILNT